jgi:predicted permease
MNVKRCMRADLRYALRGFRRSPGFTAPAILSLALGIGANTAIFSLVNAVLLRALPVRDPDRLVTFALNPPSRFGGGLVSAAAFRQIQQKDTVFDGFVAADDSSLTFSNGDDVEDVHSTIASGNFFETLGVNALIGRVFTPNDDRVNAPPVCVLGYGFWIRRFAGDPKVIGRTILLSNRPFTIIGVTPQQFTGMNAYESTDVTVPMASIQQNIVRAFGRLKHGVTAAQAQASLDVLYHQVETWNPPQQKVADIKVNLQPAGRGVFVLRGRYESPLVMLMVAVGLVLLIACANVTNLLMARASGRTREIAVRLALGAGRVRLIRQLLTESLLLTFTGAGLGVGLAIWTDHALRVLAPWQIGTPIPPEVDVNPDVRVLLVTIAIVILVSVASGLVPALQSTRLNFVPALKGETGLRAPGRLSLTSALVVVQVALSLVLLIGAGLFLRSLHNLRSVDPGFDPSRLIVTTIEPGRRGYSVTASQRYIAEIVERTSRLPGVIAVSPGLISPLSGDFAMGRVSVPGYVPAAGEFAQISINFVGPNYFKTIGTPLIAGRFFNDLDGITNKVAILNRKAARHYWPHENPIGKRIITGLRDQLDCVVVGIVNDIKTESLRADAQPTVYVPSTLNSMGHVTLHVRVAGNPAPVISALRHEIHSLDRNLQPRDITTMATQIDRTIALDRLLALLITLFGLLAATLAAVGLYGVMAFAVATRTREIGIRMALGADRVGVLFQILRESALLTALGIGAGVPAALWASRAVGSQLYGLRASDPATYIVLLLALGAVAFGATWIPARRAADVDPMVALRYE